MHRAWLTPSVAAEPLTYALGCPGWQAHNQIWLHQMMNEMACLGPILLLLPLHGGSPGIWVLDFALQVLSVGSRMGCP